MKDLLHIIQFYQPTSLRIINKEYNNVWTSDGIECIGINNSIINMNYRHLKSRLMYTNYYSDRQAIYNLFYIQVGTLPRNYV